jgi:exonuclease V gamma subunit
LNQLIFSHQIEILAEELFSQIQSLPPLEPKVILVPTEALKQWLTLQLTHFSPSQVIAGHKLFTLEAGLRYLLPKTNKASSFSEIFISIYKYLKTKNEVTINNYLQNNERKTLALAHHLSKLVFRYAEYDFIPEKGWQKDLMTHRTWKLLPELLKNQSPKVSVHCFGFAFLPPLVWQFLTSAPNCSAYLFSPCTHYWEDTHSVWEQKGLDQFWKKKGVSIEEREELQTYLQQTPPLLANLGKVGRETLKNLDQYPWEIKEAYPSSLGTDSALNRLKKRLLEFSLNPEEKEIEDDSIQIRAIEGSSLEEIEGVKQAIEELVTQKNLKLSEILVLAPDIQHYASLIEFVFHKIPYKITGVLLAKKSDLYRGWIDFCELSNSNIRLDNLLRLLENPAFGAKEEDVLAIQSIQSSDDWESKLVEDLIYLNGRQNIHFDSYEDLFTLIDTMRKDLHLLKTTSHTLKEWGKILKELFEKYFKEASCFNGLFEELEASSLDAIVPFAPILELLKKDPSEEEIHSTHLHAVQFASLHKGTLIPAKAILLIGMDEESFPTKKKSDSLDLLPKGPPDSPDEERYALLQTIFAAQEFLWISYQNFAIEEGKPLDLSFLIEEILASVDSSVPRKTYRRPSRINQTAPSLFKYEPSPLPSGFHLLHISDLTGFTKHPWKNHLKKNWGITLEEFDDIPFAVSKSQAVRQNFSTSQVFSSPLPRGLCGAALMQEIEDKTADDQEQLAAWSISSYTSLHLHRSCLEPEDSIIPSLKLELSDQLQIEIIGTIEGVSSQGYVHRGDDSIDGLLKVWPECLIALMATKSTQIFCLKSCKIKTIEDPEKCLKKFLLYYFQASSSLSPLVPDWSNSILRKDFEISEDSLLEDLIASWILERTDLPSVEIWKKLWQPLTSSHFEELQALYPVRGQKYAQV